MAESLQTPIMKLAGGGGRFPALRFPFDFTVPALVLDVSVRGGAAAGGGVAEDWRAGG